jgi:hypothetical protein
VEGPCEHGNEPSGSIKCWEILEWLSNWRLLKHPLHKSCGIGQCRSLFLGFIPAITSMARRRRMLSDMLDDNFASNSMTFRMTSLKSQRN